MKFYALKTYLVFAATFLVSASAAAQTNAELARCRTVNDPASRLACYDAIGQVAAPPAAASTDYKQVALSDLKLDKQTMRGQRIETKGFMQVMGEVVLLKDGPMDMSPVYVEVTALSRDARKIVLDCNMACNATIRGRVGPTKLMQMGIIAETVNGK